MIIEYGDTYYKKNNMNIWWNITNNCNLKCYYCKLNYEEPFTKKENLDKIIEFINFLITKKDNIHLQLFGGEPTIYPDFIYILENLNNDINISLSTNLLSSLEKIQKIEETKKVNEYNISMHFSLIDKEKFKRNLEYLISKGVNMSLGVMLEKNEYLNDIISFLNNYKQRISCLIKVVDIVTLNDIEKNIIREFNKNQNLDDHVYYIKKSDGKIKYVDYTEFEKVLKFDTNHCICYAVNNNLSIDSNGDLYPCLQYKKLKLGKIGNIISDKDVLYKINKKYILCKSNMCECEHFIPKKFIRM